MNQTRVAVLSIALLLVAAGFAKADLTLADNEQTSYRIVIASNAPPSERYAAQELAHYLHQLSGAYLPVVTDDQRPASREILLGDNAHLRALGLGIDCEKLGSDGFVLRTDGHRLILAGAKPRGTLYGVYTLLEERLGVRWFTPELEVVPRVRRISLPALNETRVPALEYREVFWTEMMRNADFAARHRLNGNHYALAPRHGGRAVVYYPFVHSFDSLVPQDLFKAHPEYFPLIKGERKGGYVQRCLSHPEVVKLSIARVREWIRQHPEASVISVSQNDTFNYCQCDTCKALDEAEGTPAASLIRFVNTIAEAIERDHPNVRIDTLAYQYTRTPPKTLRPRKNVIIRLCSIECCFAHPLATCTAKENIRFRDDIIAWQPVAPLLYIWDYTPNFAHYQQPFPNFNALQANVRFFVQHNVKGLFEQGNYSGGGYGEMGPLRAYVLAKLLWNPDTDVDRHIREFCDAYYGRASADLLSYVRLLQLQVRDPNIHAHIYDSPKAAYLNNGFVKMADGLLAEAESKAENDTTKLRVQIARLPIWYVQLANGLVAGAARTKVLDNFVTTARKAGISHISEGQGFEAWAKNMGATTGK